MEREQIARITAELNAQLYLVERVYKRLQSRVLEQFSDMDG